jgi:hypothetical protein
MTQAYDLAKDKYIELCKTGARYVRVITDKQIPAAQCMEIVYEQLKPYKLEYSKVLARQLVQLHLKAPIMETEIDKVIRKHLKAPIMETDYEDTPEYQSWADEYASATSDSGDEPQKPGQKHSVKAHHAPQAKVQHSVKSPDSSALRGVTPAEVIDYPNAFICPFFFDVMDNPIVLSDGRSYDLPMVALRQFLLPPLACRILELPEARSRRGPSEERPSGSMEAATE